MFVHRSMKNFPFLHCQCRFFSIIKKEGLQKQWSAIYKLKTGNSPPIKTLDRGSGYPIAKHRLIGDVRIITHPNLVSLYHLGSYCFQDQCQFHSDKRLSDIIKKPCLVIIGYWIELNKPTSLIVTKPLNMSVNTTELTPITISFAAKLIATLI
jgi:hypothetical protein